jgi:hypothetical protein
MTAIKLFESKKVRALWVEEEQKWFFSVIDVVGVLTDSADTEEVKKSLREKDK